MGCCASSVPQEAGAQGDSNKQETQGKEENKSSEADNMSSKRVEEYQEETEKLRVELVQTKKRLDTTSTDLTTNQSTIKRKLFFCINLLFVPLKKEIKKIICVCIKIELQDEVRVLKMQLETTRAELTAVADEKSGDSKASHERRQSVANVLKMSNEMEKLQQQIVEKDEILLKKKTVVAKLKNANTQLESKINNNEVELQQFASKWAAIQAANEKLETQQKDLEKQLEFENIDTQMIRCKKKQKLLVIKNLFDFYLIVQLRQQVHSLRNESARRSVSYSKSMQAEDHLQLENAQLKKDFPLYKANKQPSEKSKEKRDPEFLQQLFNEREELKKRLTAVQSNFKSKSYEYDLKIEELNRDKEAFSKKFQDYEQIAVKHEKEMTALQLRLDLLNKEKQGVEKQMTDLTIELQNLKNNAATPTSNEESAVNTQKLLKGLFGRNNAAANAGSSDEKSGEKKGTTAKEGQQGQGQGQQGQGQQGQGQGQQGQGQQGQGQSSQEGETTGTVASADAPKKLTLAEKIALAKKAQEEQGKKNSEGTSAEGKPDAAADASKDPKQKLLEGLLKKSANKATPAPQEATTETAGASPSPMTPLSEAADRFAKYEKMKKVGMPPQAIRNKMKTDKISDEDIAKFFGETPPASATPKPAEAAVDLSKHDLSKYDKMKKVGMPDGAIRNKMKQDKIDEKVIAAYFGDPIPQGAETGAGAGAGAEEEEEEMKPPGEKPDLTKYERFKKINMPPPAIRQKMKQDQIHEYWICTFLGEPIPKIKKGAKPPPPKPDLGKYETMKKVGMPEGAIRNKMKQDKIDEYWIAFFFGEPLPGGAATKKPAKKVQRNVKPFHWRKKSDCEWEKTIWGEVKIDDSFFDKQMQGMIENNFRNVDPADKKKDDKKKQDKKEPEEITLLDGKRSFNINVGLSRVNMTDIEIRDCLLTMDETVDFYHKR
ncbi:hypothetical protein RFI_08740 [Reticulomyxa filosa]|uniref:FH2 domain-containing protein n=1 Tax=Reticulomyxa filosa TaxID=46433 RepID=X6NRR4_RETFI|nr:hypothetical protein RFI_08740 [Reticulomyxa filosa]|eukprot:ETO28384.1 hypothetical protein RFI_08740 [Reticulomyxa filosa]